MLGGVQRSVRGVLGLVPRPLMLGSQPARSAGPVTYEENEKHCNPAQRGQRGSLCPREIDDGLADQLLQGSVLDGQTRYATHGGRAYKAAQHRPGKWHGWPVGWVEVPQPIKQQFLKQKLVKKRDTRRFWESSE